MSKSPVINAKRYGTPIHSPVYIMNSKGYDTPYSQPGLHNELKRLFIYLFICLYLQLASHKIAFHNRSANKIQQLQKKNK